MVIDPSTPPNIVEYIVAGFVLTSPFLFGIGYVVSVAMEDGAKTVRPQRNQSSIVKRLRRRRIASTSPT
jgi:hypothetical protein